MPACEAIETFELGMVTGKLDLGKAGPSTEELHDYGKRLRKNVPRESHAEWIRPKNRPDPVDTVVGSNKGRQESLVPLRMGRMAATPFTFLRGAAAVMASDLSNTPSTGHSVAIDGDAHLNNFGFYGTPERDLIFDLNDFDEATWGPWEWDLKRLVASVNVAARDNGMDRRARRAAVLRCVQGYRANMRRLRAMGSLDIWYLHVFVDRTNSLRRLDQKTHVIVAQEAARARSQTNAKLLAKIAERTAGGWRFRPDPPILAPVDEATKRKVTDGLNEYSSTLLRERKRILFKYHVADVAHRVVGVGSVGLRAYLVLLLGRQDNDPLFLQVKEAGAAAHAPFLPKLPDEFAHDGKRVVNAQRALQASPDLLLGWTSIGGRPYYVRQMKNMKGGIPVGLLAKGQLGEYALYCGALLARAHARNGEPALINGYCGASSTLDEAFADWAEAYGNQNASDHAALVEAIRKGRIKAVKESL